MTDLEAIDNQITDPAFLAGEAHHEVFRTLRVEDPVRWTIGKAVKPFWSITRHADCARILKDPGTFSSVLGGIMPPTAAWPTTEEWQKGRPTGSRRRTLIRRYTSPSGSPSTNISPARPSPECADPCSDASIRSSMRCCRAVSAI